MNENVLNDDFTRGVTAFHAAAEWTGVMDTDRDAWLALRREIITASDVAAIMGENPRRDAFDVFVEKTVPRIDLTPPDIHSRMFWGKVLEQPILTTVAEFYGWQYRRGGALLRNRQHRFLGATLDAEIDRGTGPMILEGKTTTLAEAWDEETQRLPMVYLIQVESQLAVVEQERALVFAYVQSRGDPACLIEIESVPGLRQLILETAEEFMARVRALQSPPVSALSANALHRLYPTSDGRIVELPDVACDWTAELEKIGRQMKELADRKEQLRNQLREAIGDALAGKLPDASEGGTLFWKNKLEHRGAYIQHVDARSGRILRALKREPKEKPKTRTAVFREKPTPENQIETKLAESVAVGPIVYGKRR